MGFVHYKRGLGKEASLSHCAHAQLEPGNGSSPGSAKSSSSWAPHLQTIRNKSGFFINYLSSYGDVVIATQRQSWIPSAAPVPLILEEGNPIFIW